MTGRKDASTRSNRGRGTRLLMPAAYRAAGEAVAHVTGQPAVHLQIDGSAMLAAFEPDFGEHHRRLTSNVEAVTSTPILHGLWLLPSGVRVPASALPDRKVDALRRAAGFVAESEAGFERLYSPAGVVRAVAFVGRDGARALERAVRFTPILQRLVVVTGTTPIAGPTERLAREWGVGLVAVDEGVTRVVVSAGPPERGVPSVYRWWIAELAYRSWLYESTQPVSCAFGCSGPWIPARP
jgi:hypothetical protein